MAISVYTDIPNPNKEGTQAIPYEGEEVTPTNKGNYPECENCEYKLDVEMSYPCAKSHTEIRDNMTDEGCGLEDCCLCEAEGNEQETEELSYRFFLFAHLYDCVLKEDAKLEYDLLFPKVVAHYYKYLESSYNDHNMSEYECIIDFLENSEDEK